MPFNGLCENQLWEYPAAQVFIKPINGLCIDHKKTSKFERHRGTCPFYFFLHPSSGVLLSFCFPFEIKRGIKSRRI